MPEIKFKKYKTKGVDYHWQNISWSVKKRNIFVLARYQIILKLIKSEIKSKKLLDVGCGDGVLSYLLTKNGAYVTGIDSSNEAIQYVDHKFNSYHNLNFKIASVYALPFSDNSFNFIVSTEVIEHLKNPDKMLTEIKRVWNKSGKIIITTPVKIAAQPEDRMHFQEYFEEEFLTLLKKYFQEIKIIKSHPLFWLELQKKGQTNIFPLRPRFYLNCLNLLFGFNPFLNTKGWHQYTLQTAIITK